MQYKNLNSLGRAYRAGDVSRSTYIQQRRQFIDAFTKDETEGAEAVTHASEQSEFDEAATVVSTSDELRTPKDGTNSATEGKHLLSWKYILPLVALVVIIAAYVIFRTTGSD